VVELSEDLTRLSQRYEEFAWPDAAVRLVAGMEDLPLAAPSIPIPRPGRG
jgi:hypothetical protein